MFLLYTRAMLKILSNFFSWLFPLPESSAFIVKETEESILRFYNLGRYQGIIFLAPYKIRIISACVSANKFFNDQHGAQLLASLLKRWLVGQNQEQFVLVPIPLSSKRERERGYNQVTRILDFLPKEFTIKQILTKVRDTKPQTSLKRLDRLTNLEEVFTVHECNLPIDKTYIIIDDVTTTGATLKAAEVALRKKLGKDLRVILLAITH